jgi:hypothetical protein
MTMIEGILKAFRIQTYMVFLDLVSRMRASAREPPCAARLPSSRAVTGFAKPVGELSKRQPGPVLTAGEILRGSTGEYLVRAFSYPPSPGYEPLLISLGVSLGLARLAAYLFIRVGYRVANDNATRPHVVEALRFLAKPGRLRPSAIARRAKILLSARRDSSVLEEIFQNADIEFAELLEPAIEGRESAHCRLRAMAAAVAPRIRVNRGPKICAASAAHEFFLKESTPLIGSRAYTWDDLAEDYVDELTQATRIEFGEPDFDPRPARRRLTRAT